MKKTAVIFIAVVTALFGGCSICEVTEATTLAEQEETSTASMVTVIPETTEVVATEELTVAVIEEHTQEASNLIAEESSVEQTSIIEEKTTEEEKTVNTEKTTGEEKTTREEKTTAKIPEEVELSISIPEKNGTMETDASPDNKYIKIVNKEKKIDKSLLLAVYSVPESGQNYVFEFYDKENSDADNIRRVYLIDSNGKISSIAATESDESENISPVENWFCMNVLIKEIIYPAVSADR